MSLLSRVRAQIRDLWQRAKNERASPRQIALAIGIGAFVGCTPAVGFHGGLAVAVATLLRLNRLFSFIGSRVSNMLILPWITLAELHIGHLVRTGQGIEISVQHAMDEGPKLLLDWCIGSVPVGGVLGVLLGALAYAIAKRRKRDEDLRPTSESPP